MHIRTGQTYGQEVAKVESLIFRPSHHAYGCSFVPLSCILYAPCLLPLVPRIPNAMCSISSLIAALPGCNPSETGSPCRCHTETCTSWLYSKDCRTQAVNDVASDSQNCDNCILLSKG